MDKSSPSYKGTILFVVIICFIASLILSGVSISLQSAKEKAKQLDKSKQLLIAAKILSSEGYFLVKEKGKYIKAAFVSSTNLLQAESNPPKATNAEITKIYRQHILEKKVTKEGILVDTNSDQQGFLLYEIVTNKNPTGYVIPIKGFGLWDAIYGYLAIETDGKTVIGTTWYEQEETAGLGANIALASWQKQFEGKSIFQPSSDGSINPATSPLGIQVVKGKVSEVYPNSAKSINAVDGISGASLTGAGVTQAYKSSLALYRPFFVQLQKKNV